MSFDLRRSRQTIFGQSTEFLIGEMLVKAGVIKQSQLDDALKLAGNKHMQIGQMLIMARYITPKDLQAAIDAQIAVRDRVLEANAALRALSNACRGGISFAEASAKQSQESPTVNKPNQLGDLLLESGLINAEQLSIAIQKSAATGLPVGRILILNNVISEAILSAALEMRIKLRDGTVSNEAAIACLSDLIRAKEINDLGLAGLEHATLNGQAAKAGDRHSIRLGEFFVLAGILSETDVMNALEFSLVSDRPLGQTFIEHGYVTEELVEVAVKLQTLVESDSLDCQKAALCLNHIHLNGVGLAEAIEIITSQTEDGIRIDFQTLLFDSNLITSERMQAALEIAVNNPRILSKLLVQTGYLSDVQAAIMVDCHEAIVQKLIGEQDAKFALDFCLQKLSECNITFADALQELGWSGQTADVTTNSQSIVEEPIKQVPGGSDLERSMLGSGAAAGQSFVSNPNASFNSLPAQSLQSSDPAAANMPSQSTDRQVRRKGRTTTNLPALTNIQAGAELLRSPGDDADQIDSPAIDESQDNTIAAEQAAAPKSRVGIGRAADKSLSLRALLVGEGIPEDAPAGNDAQENTPPPAKDQDKETRAEAKSQNKNSQANLNTDDSLELSESEKALIIKASSLTASPEEIMAAMKLAARKDRMTNPSSGKGK